MKHHFPKRLLSAALTLALLAGLLCTSAFAADFVKAEPINGTGGDGKITVTVYNQTPGDVGTGAQWTGGSDPVEGVGINALYIGSVVELTTEDTTDGAATQVAFGLSESIATTLGLQVNTAIATNGSSYYFAPQVVQAAVQSASQTTLETLAANSGHLNDVTDDHGVAEFENLPYGLYLLAKSALPAEATTDFAPFLVSVPMYVEGTGGAAGTWNKDVYAYPKVRTGNVSLTKTTSSDQFVNAGETIPYTLTATIPATGTGDGQTKNFTEFAITDTNTAKTLNVDTAQNFVVKLKADATEQTLAAKTASAPAGDYEVSYNDSGVLTITFTPAGLTKLNANLGKEQTVTVTYNATVNTAVAFNSQLANSAVLTYNRGSGQLTASSDAVNRYTYGIDLTKVLSDSAAITANTISFALYSDEACNNQIPVVAGNGGYWRAAATATSANMYVGMDGSLMIYGLEPGTYYLKETATQSGYTLLDKPITVVITGPADPDQSNTPTATVNGANATVSNQKLVQLTVTNTRMNGTTGGFQLPKTGGEGTLLVTAIGLGLLCVAVVLLVVYRKKSRN